MLNIQESGQQYKISFLHLAFRPFFLAAGVFAVLSMFIWMGIYSLGWNITFQNIPQAAWHGHEMIFGYSLAVIGGFLLTAIKNWTGIKTLNGAGLLLLFLFWGFSRLLPFIPVQNNMSYMIVTETLFIIGLFIAALIPTLKVRQWKQTGILVVLLLFLISDGLFYLSILGKTSLSYKAGLHMGLYLVLLMIFIMARRVVPFFIERGVGYKLQITNWVWLDIVSLVIFLLFAGMDIFSAQPIWVASLAGALTILHGIRLWQWYARGIWTKPLLWILYLAYVSLVLGFALKVAGIFFYISPYLSLHAFTVGGVGMMTLGMMARVTLGHTGRNVFEPPRILVTMFLLMVVAAISRVILPLLWVDGYNLWVLISQVFWICSFGLFVIVYAPMLIKPRVDGQYG